METSVYERISETNKKVRSNKSRIVVFILSFFLPFGTHNFYLGYHIKGIIQVGIAIGLLLFIPPLFLLFILPFYIAWITSEGLTYLLWYKVKDGNDFRLYDKDHPPVPSRRKAIWMAFLLPFGLHNFYLGRLKIAIIEWGLIATFVSIQIITSLTPGISLIVTNYLYLFSLLLIPSWIEGIWMLIKR
jgi:TM2 domain-containing membrane protein YozV